MEEMRKSGMGLGSRGDELLPLDRLPLHGQGADNGETAHGEADVEGLGDGAVVGRQHAGQRRGRDLALDAGGTDVEYDVRVELGRGAREPGREPVREDVLRDRDEEGAAEGLHEDDDGRARRHVLDLEHGLGRD